MCFTVMIQVMHVGCAHACMLIPTNYNIKIINHITDKNGRYSILHTFIEDADVVLANIYAPTKNNEGDQILFLAELRQQLLNFLGKKIILGGRL